jgi:predicted DsbA family dithiol-disulfide isomerase
MTTISLVVWSDYVCPWCYLGLREVQTLKGEFELQFEWKPYLLRPDAPEEGSPLPAHVKEFLKEPDNALVLRARALGVTLKQRDVVPNSRRAHESTEFARSQGRAEPFHEKVLERYWSHGDDLHDWAVLQRIALEVGLDPAQLKAEVEAGRWRASVEDSLAQAAAAGVNAVPTFIIGAQFVVRGAQSADVFRQAFKRL